VLGIVALVGNGFTAVDPGRCSQWSASCRTPTSWFWLHAELAPDGNRRHDPFNADPLRRSLAGTTPLPSAVSWRNSAEPRSAQPEREDTCPNATV
jgi:hypothetical protein